MQQLVIEQHRGFAVEGEHVIDAVLCDERGQVVAQIGADALTTFRSSAKPFQLEVSLSLLSESTRAQLSRADLALGAASHHGEPVHLAQLTSLLERVGCAPSQLYCGVHPPAHAPSAQALWARGETPSVLHNNCSGKHAFMAAACAAQGFVADYRDAEHPLQRQMLATLQHRSGQTVAGTVVDGCGVPCFVLPLSGMARAWAALAHEVAGEGDSALGEIGRAMREHPLLMSGSDAFDGWLVRHTSAVAKVGAQGLLCIALPEQRLGLALKSRSGADVARPAAALAVLDRLVPGWLREAPPPRFTHVTNLVGARVGEQRAVWR
jgi:L-asparaginase II